MGKVYKNKGGIKLNTLFDINAQILAFIHITPASSHDVNAMNFLVYEIGAYYIFDRGYVDYIRLYKINQFAAFFVVRAKRNLKFNRMYSRKYDKTPGVKSDQIGKLTGYYVSKEYPDKIRKVRQPPIYSKNSSGISSAHVSSVHPAPQGRLASHIPPSHFFHQGKSKASE